MSKGEETIRRWLRKGDVFPNAQYKSDKEGWKIPAADIQSLKLSINEQTKTNNQTLTVSEVASRLGKSEETIKRWLRSGEQFPHAFKNSDVQGWRIPENDLTYMNFKQAPPVRSPIIKQSPSVSSNNVIHQEINKPTRDQVTLAYKVATLTSPTENMVELLSHVGTQRCLEILLVMQQSRLKVRNVEGFIKKAIRENWIPDSVPIKLPRNQSKKLYELTQDEFLQIANKKENPAPSNVPFYNWLEED
ncbi:helix-turn-helix domain-containing protein [Peribacillus butanolivorans]|uniref:helix-turn-helix domain-containing protein n=1 Tax=Peribacillus butanolivorans TaxID=421767 RepID=UPI0036A82AFB